MLNVGRKLNLDFLGSFWELVTQAAECFLEICQRFSTESFYGKQSCLSKFKLLKDLSNFGDLGFCESFGSPVSQIEFGNRSLWRCARCLTSFDFGDVIVTSLEFLIETINLSLSVNNSLFTCVKRMTLGTYVGVDNFKSRTCCPGVPTCADHLSVGIINRVRIFFHL